MKDDEGLRGEGQSITLWRKHPTCLELDPQVWWWRDMMKAIGRIPATHNSHAAYAAIRLAEAYWADAELRADPAYCAKRIGMDPRTVRRHWDEIRLILDRYFSDMIEERPKVVALRRAKQIAGEKSGESRRAARLPHACCTDAARVRAGSAEVCHFPRTERETETEQEGKPSELPETDMSWMLRESSQYRR